MKETIMVDQNYEGDLNYTTIEGPDGVERTYVEDVILEHDGKEFAVLIEVLDDDSTISLFYNLIK